MIKIDEVTSAGPGVSKLVHVEINGQVFAKEMAFEKEPSVEHETLALAHTFQGLIMDIKMAVESAYGDTPAVGTEDNPACRSMSNVKRSKKVDVPTEEWQKDVEKKLNLAVTQVEIDGETLYTAAAVDQIVEKVKETERRLEALEKGENK